MTQTTSKKRSKLLIKIYQTNNFYTFFSVTPLYFNYFSFFINIFTATPPILFNFATK